MVHIVGERYLETLVKGLEKFRLTHIKRSAERAQKNLSSSHLNFALEGPQADYRIQDLIVTCPEYATLAAVSQLRPRLDSGSTILLLNELPGVVDRVRGLWPISSPPTIIVGLPPTVDTFTLSGCDDEEDGESNLLAQKILNASSNWCAEWYPHQEFMLTQLENLVVRSTIEPLCLALDCTPQQLQRDEYSHMMYQLVAESCNILSKAYKEPLIEPSRMHRLVKDRAKSYPLNFELKNAVRTRSYAPLGYLNGTLCRLAKKHAVPHPFNMLFQNLVQTKTLIPEDMKCA